MWSPFQSGATIGTEGSESGTIVADLEHELGARITIEQGGTTAPFAITCGIYGSFGHTCFFKTREAADSQCAAMQAEMHSILQLFPEESDPDHDAKSEAVFEAISDFVASH